MDYRPSSQCEIRNVGLARNGSPRFWCVVHRADATGKGGVQLDRCKGYGPAPKSESAIEFDPEDYPGGLALWGSVSPVFDTTHLPVHRGVHVHARKEAEGPKEIDDTYDRVTFSYRRDLLDNGKVTIDGDTAVAHYLANFVGNQVDCLFCTYCGNPHADTDTFAVIPHQRHLCHACGRLFTAETRGVSNPLALLAGYRRFDSRNPRLSEKTLDIRQADYPGGIQVWASNPAIIWIAGRPEESGIHVHAYGVEGRRLVDDTFGSVIIDGVQLGAEEVAYLMAQNSMPSLAGKVVTLTCNTCGSPVFSKGKAAFGASMKHVCECGSNSSIKSSRKVVSNPLVQKLVRLKGTE